MGLFLERRKEQSTQLVYRQPQPVSPGLSVGGCARRLANALYPKLSPSQDDGSQEISMDGEKGETKKPRGRGDWGLEIISRAAERLRYSRNPLISMAGVSLHMIRNPATLDGGWESSQQAEGRRISARYVHPWKYIQGSVYHRMTMLTTGRLATMYTPPSSSSSSPLL